VLIVHNALTLHFNLPLTAALWTLADGHRARIISWVHDISWLNPIYRPWMHEGEPWDLLRRQHPRITSIFVSAQRREEWNRLTGTALDATHVIPNGIDAAALLKLGPRAIELTERFGLLRADIVMLAPLPALALALTLPRVGADRTRRRRGRMGTPALITRTAPEEN